MNNKINNGLGISYRLSIYAVYKELDISSFQLNQTMQNVGGMAT